MSPAFIKGVGDSPPTAAITFDKFHAVKITGSSPGTNEAVDAVRRAEQKGQSGPRGASTEGATEYLKKWYFWASHSRLDPMIEADRTVKRRGGGILRWFDSRVAN